MYFIFSSSSGLRGRFASVVSCGLVHTNLCFPLLQFKFYFWSTIHGLDSKTVQKIHYNLHRIDNQHSGMIIFKVLVNFLLVKCLFGSCRCGTICLTLFSDLVQCIFRLLFSSSNMNVAGWKVLASSQSLPVWVYLVQVINFKKSQEIPPIPHLGYILLLFFLFLWKLGFSMFISG